MVGDWDWVRADREQVAVSWNYRIIDWGDEFCVHEVYYDTDGAIKAYGPVRELSSDCGEELVGDLEQMLASVRKHPIIKKDDLPVCGGGFATRNAEQGEG